MGARTASVDFNGFEERHDAAGADLVFDTRLDPSFPRNAVHTVVGWERLGFGPASAGRWLGDARGYIGVGGSNVLALRTQFALANAALPPSEQSLLGGGERCADTRLAIARGTTWRHSRPKCEYR